MFSISSWFSWSWNIKHKVITFDLMTFDFLNTLREDSNNNTLWPFSYLTLKAQTTAAQRRLYSKYMKWGNATNNIKHDMCHIRTNLSMWGSTYYILNNLKWWSYCSLKLVILTSLRFCNRSSNLSLALFAMTLFLSVSYCLCVLSILMLRFRATLTKAVINFMAGKDDKVQTQQVLPTLAWLSRWSWEC